MREAERFNKATWCMKMAWLEVAGHVPAQTTRSAQSYLSSAYEALYGLAPDYLLAEILRLQSLAILRDATSADATETAQDVVNTFVSQYHSAHDQLSKWAEKKLFSIPLEVKELLVQLSDSSDYFDGRDGWAIIKELLKVAKHLDNKDYSDALQLWEDLHAE